MDSKKKITISWSGGKDSALALHLILEQEMFEVRHLHTVIGKSTKRVGLHGIREELIREQARQLDLPLVIRYLEDDNTHQAYEKLVLQMYQDFRDEGISHILFGDIFLEDLRAYRENLLRESGLIPVFPLWKLPSLNLLGRFIDGGFKTVICAANEMCFNADLLGRVMDKGLLQEIPPGIDPCGENGEFHTYVFDGPMFRSPVPYTLGEMVARTYDYDILENKSIKRKSTTFYFQEILPLR
jgi:uncharacterized protein (TIGR00290 family)